MAFKGYLNEFRKFISRGNVIDMAIGIIIGSAFTGIVNSLVEGVFMPMLGFVINGINFSDLRIILSPASEDAAEVAILYGGFIQKVINFLIISFVVFMFVSVLNKFHKKKEPESAAPPAPSPECLLLTEIRDLLNKTDADKIQ